jgi:hypothetical protein
VLAFGFLIVAALRVLVLGREFSCVLEFGFLVVAALSVLVGVEVLLCAGVRFTGCGCLECPCWGGSSPVCWRSVFWL